MPWKPIRSQRQDKQLLQLNLNNNSTNPLKQEILLKKQAPLQPHTLAPRTNKAYNMVSSLSMVLQGPLFNLRQLIYKHLKRSSIHINSKFKMKVLRIRSTLIARKTLLMIKLFHPHQILKKNKNKMTLKLLQLSQRR